MTIPCAALVGAGLELVTRASGGAALAFALAPVIAGLAFTARAMQTRRLLAEE